MVVMTKNWSHTAWVLNLGEHQVSNSTLFSKLNTRIVHLTCPIMNREAKFSLGHH